MKINWPWIKPKDNWFVLVFSIALAQLAGIIGTFFTISAIPSWYATLIKPFFSPPNWIFGPVWIVLYTFMGISAYLVWRKLKFHKKSYPFWTSYITQLILNSLWSIIFFGGKLVGLAFIEIIILAYLVYRTILSSRKIDLTASYLLYPYLAWVSFAALLNLAILILNY